MIFQINYKSNGKYDEYFDKNRSISSKLNHVIYEDEFIDDFLDSYGYREWVESVKITRNYKHLRIPIICDLIRLLILYEKGGIYIDADTIFKDKMLELESNMEKYGNRNVFLDNKNLGFVRGIKHSGYLKKVLAAYKAKELTVDKFMVYDRKLSNNHKELFLLPYDHVNRYFTHLYDHNNSTKNEDNNL